ncbi:hypothetical protein EDD80_10893 [Anseongella ginsenosidimutans]|uniref:Uncharacterized protein n=1 Tax=Anseongella ginsenosidimutans TaxID=496056 RepID=A0A4R3KQM2_9SPHI|nr:hypothetical protein [Anseongella ginsenosidimutans]TCS86301.1 hypothetical protein EDD80_10893 [Anseongella ginsenosidimutans]
MLAFVILSAVLSGCYRMRASKGGGQIQAARPRIINAADISLTPGYKIEPVAKVAKY